MSDQQVEQINSALQKTELLAAVGREIDRVDRAASLQGYTTWAVRGAIALLVWQLFENAKDVRWPEAFRLLYVLVFSALAISSFYSLVCGDQARQSNRRYFFLLASSPARRASAATLFILSALLAVGSYFVLGGTSPVFYMPVLFFSVISAALLFYVFLPWVPVAKEAEEESESFLQRWIPRVLVTLFFVASIYSFWNREWIPSALLSSLELKVSSILVVLIVLVLSDVSAMEGREKNQNLRRLELDLSLGKSSVQEVRERFEVLMLGLTAQEVVRPWVQTVVNSLDDARSRIQEGESLLDTVRRELAQQPLTVGGLTAVDLLISRSSVYQKGAKQAVEDADQARKKLSRRLLFLKGFAKIELNEIKSELSLIEQSAKEAGDAVDAFGAKMISIKDDLTRIKAALRH